jgi:DNA-directed RNA polymerase subunit L
MSKAKETAKSRASVERFSVSRYELTAEKAPELMAMFGIARLPLAEAQVELELKGVSTAVVNALRRTVCDEMLGYCLQVAPTPEDAVLTTEQFMLPQFYNQRISLIPLRPQIPPEVVSSLELGLDVTNRGTADMSVYAGDLEVVGTGALSEPLFNPTFRIAVLQPGRRLVIRSVKIAAGYGRDNAAFMVARRTAHRHLDLPEHPRKETHEQGGAAVDLSGYKDSCLVSDPRHHVLRATLPATTADYQSEARATFAEACSRVKERLRIVAATLSASVAATSGATFTVVRLQSGESSAGLELGTLQVPGETHTIGVLLRQTVYEMHPEISFVGYSIAADILTVTVRHTSDVARILAAAVQQAVLIFDTIQQGITAS